MWNQYRIKYQLYVTEPRGLKMSILNQFSPHEEQSLRITHFVAPKITTHKSQLNSIGIAGRDHFH